MFCVHFKNPHFRKCAETIICISVFSSMNNHAPLIKRDCRVPLAGNWSRGASVVADPRTLHFEALVVSSLCWTARLRNDRTTDVNRVQASPETSAQNTVTLMTRSIEYSTIHGINILKPP